MSDTTTQNGAKADAIAAELDKLGDAPATDAPPAEDSAPVKGRRRRSGTSGAERARRAKAEQEKATGTTTPRARTTRKAAPKIAEGMAQLYTYAGLGVAAVPGPPAVAAFGAGATVTGVVGQQLVANAGAIGAAWEQAAKDDPRIREALEKLLTVSTLGAIVAAHAPVILAAFAAAGKVPPALVGIAEPVA